MISLGDRIKANYENVSRATLIRRMPVIVRVDGRAFHTYCRGLDKPFDQDLVDAMASAAGTLAEQMQGFKAAYIQSDEASFLLTDYDTLQTEPWFGYVTSKVVSISASIMTAAFNRHMKLVEQDAYFDARAFNIPREEVANYFLWRMRDWERNSLAMYCKSFFSHKELIGKNASERHEMLHRIGKNWTTDLDDQLRNGTWLIADGGEVFSVEPNYANIDAMLAPLIHVDRENAA